MESWRGGRWWASRHEPWRNQVKRTVHWKQGKNRVNAEELKKTKNNYRKTSEKKWLRYYLMECRCPLTSAGNWLRPRVSRTQPELRRGEKNKLQIPQHPRLSHSFINVCCAVATHAKTLFFTTMMCWAVVLGAVPHSPGLADSHCSLQETPLYGWACSFKSERETYLCAVYEIWQPREKCWSSVFSHI